MNALFRNLFRAYDFYIFSIVLFVIPNAQLFNMLLRYGPLAVWKQVLAVLLHVIVLRLFFFNKVHPQLERGCVQGMRNFYLFALIAVGFLGLFSLLRGVPPMRIIYGGISVVGFLPFVFYPAIAIYRSKVREMIFCIVATGAFCGVGLVVDYFFNVFGLLASVLRVDILSLMADHVGFGFRRAMFLFVGANAIWPFMSVPLILILSLLCSFRRAVPILVYFSMIGAISIGLFLTNTRAIWILLFVFLLCAIGLLLVFAKNKIVNICVGVVAASCLVAGILYMVQNVEQGAAIIDRFNDFFSSYDSSNDHRFMRWHQGAELFVSRIDWFDYFIGSGVGTTVLSLRDYFPTNTHFESSFFRAYYEGGCVLLLVTFLPVFMIVLYCFRMPMHNRVRGLFLLWVGLYFVSICVAPISGDYYNQIAIYTMLGLAYCEVNMQAFSRSLHEIVELGYFSRRRR